MPWRPPRSKRASSRPFRGPRCRAIGWHWLLKAKPSSRRAKRFFGFQATCPTGPHPAQSREPGLGFRRSALRRGFGQNAKRPGPRTPKSPRQAPPQTARKTAKSEKVGEHKAPRCASFCAAQGVVVRDVVHCAVRQSQCHEKHNGKQPSQGRVGGHPRTQHGAKHDETWGKPTVAEIGKGGIHVGSVNVRRGGDVAGFGQEMKGERKGRKQDASGPSQVTISG